MFETDIGREFRREMDTLMTYLKEEIPTVVGSIDERIAHGLHIHNTANINAAVADKDSDPGFFVGDGNFVIVFF